MKTILRRGLALLLCFILCLSFIPSALAEEGVVEERTGLHPNEFIDEKRDDQPIERRASNLIAYWMGDVLRHRLKVRNLGEKALPIYERELAFFQRKGFEFLTCKDLYRIKTT